MTTAVLALATQDFLDLWGALLDCARRAHQDQSFEDDEAGCPGRVLSFLQAYFEVMREAVYKFVPMRGEVVHQLPKGSLLEDFLFFSPVAGAILHVLLLPCGRSIPLVQLIDQLSSQVALVGLRSETSTSHFFLI